MLGESLARLLELPDEARVLDVGGWAAHLNRADGVIDLMPYESRGALLRGGVGPKPERFAEDTWVQRDICDRSPWPFEDDFFDFVACTFTLEDVRDPIGVCREMSRVGKAGYVEVPSLLDELSWRVPEPSGGPWVGHMHHRWLCALEGDELVFLPKWHSLHSNRRVRVPARLGRRLTTRDRTLAHFWEGELPAREREAIESYPLEELERAIRAQQEPGRAELAAMELSDVGARLRERTAPALRRLARTLREAGTRSR